MFTPRKSMFGCLTCLRRYLQTLLVSWKLDSQSPSLVSGRLHCLRLSSLIQGGIEYWVFLAGVGRHKRKRLFRQNRMHKVGLS